MKKLFITLALFFVTILSFSQSSTYYTTMVKRGEYNTYTQKYVWNEGTRIDIKIDFLDNYVRIYDQAKSYYLLTGGGKEVNTDDYTSTQWDGKDEQGRNVLLSIIHYLESDQFVVMVVYSKLAFAYVLDKDRFPLNR